MGVFFLYLKKKKQDYDIYFLSCLFFLCFFFFVLFCFVLFFGFFLIVVHLSMQFLYNLYKTNIH